MFISYLNSSSNKTISKLKSDLEEAEDLMAKEREEAKRNLEKRLRDESSKLLRESSERIDNLETELAEYRLECERLKQFHSDMSNELFVSDVLAPYLRVLVICH